MKKRIIAVLLSVVLASCAFQDSDSLKSATQSTQTSTIQLAPTYPVVAPQTVVNFSSQQSLIIKEKKEALYSYDKQVIDNGFSLSAEEVNPHCHKDEEGDGTRAPMSVKFTFRNLTPYPLTIPDRFAFHPSAPSGYVGADFTTVFFLESGERLYTSGDNFASYDPVPNSFMDMLPNDAYTVTLDVAFPYQIGMGDGPLYYFAPGYYFVKFIYWAARVERLIDEGGPHPGIGPAISSNAIIVCIE